MDMLVDMKVEFFVMMTGALDLGTSGIKIHLRCTNFVWFDSCQKWKEVDMKLVDIWELEFLCWKEVFRKVRLSYIHCFLIFLKNQKVLRVTT